MSLLARLKNSTHDDEEEYEDVFASGLNTLFTNTGVNFHGWSGSTIQYASPVFGDIVLNIPSEPETSHSRQLFAHYIWNSALIAAAAIESASNAPNQIKGAPEGDDWTQVRWDSEYWNVRGQDVLELGAGTALPSIMCLSSGARLVTATDHPDSPAVKAGNIEANVRLNISKYPNRLHNNDSKGDCSETSAYEAGTDFPENVRIYGYLWGTTTFTPRHSRVPCTPDSIETCPNAHVLSCTTDSTFTRCTKATASASLQQSPLNVPLFDRREPSANSFTKIIVADCLWLPSKHASIIHTILTYLQPPSSSHSPECVPCAMVISNFHTGRGPVSDFLYLATGTGSPSDERVSYDEPVSDDEDSSVMSLRQRVRGKLELVESFEIDLDGEKRAWKGAGVEAGMLEHDADMGDEERSGKAWGRDDDRRWCLCAVLVKRDCDIDSQ